MESMTCELFITRYKDFFFSLKTRLSDKRNDVKTKSLIRPEEARVKLGVGQY